MIKSRINLGDSVLRTGDREVLSLSGRFGRSVFKVKVKVKVKVFPYKHEKLKAQI